MGGETSGKIKKGQQSTDAPCKTRWQREVSSLPPSNFSYPHWTVVCNYYMENSRNKQLLSFKLCAHVSNVMKSHTTGPCPAQDGSVPTL